MPKCPRCGKDMNMSIMSRFNTQMICFACDDKEREHPSYNLACKAEEAAVRHGDYNYPGIGLPTGL